MLDVHSHILPYMDDGSSSTDESHAMLSSLYRQGVNTVVATPHFYASVMSPSDFFERRQRAYEQLRGTPGRIPIEVRLGAEVLYFEGLQGFAGLSDFRISGTELLLLEMPFLRWSERMIRNVVELNSENGLTVVLAHIDRYFAEQPLSVFEKLADHGVLMQVNAAGLLDWHTRRKALRLYRNGLIQFIGSDCHNMKDRSPKMADAVAYIEKRLGEAAVGQLQSSEDYWFHGMEKIV